MIRLTFIVNGLDEALNAKVIDDFLANPPKSMEELYMLIKRKYDAMNFIQPQMDFAGQRRVRFNDYELNDDRSRRNRDDRFQGRRSDRRDSYGNNSQMNQLVRSIQNLTNNFHRLNSATNTNNFNSSNPNNNATSGPTNSNQPTFGQNWFNGKPQERANDQQLRKNYDNYQCYHCNKFGHISHNCPEKNNPSNSSPVRNTFPKNLNRQN